MSKVAIVKENGDKIEISRDRLQCILIWAQVGFEREMKESNDSLYKRTCEELHRQCLDLRSALWD